jgi:hypothetical protein
MKNPSLFPFKPRLAPHPFRIVDYRFPFNPPFAIRNVENRGRCIRL